MTANDFRGCMRKAIGGDYGAKQPFEGTLAWANIIHRFLLVFFSKKETGLDRAKNAGFVQGMLRRNSWSNTQGELFACSDVRARAARCNGCAS